MELIKGDDCLQEVPEVIRSVVKRRTDMVARYGGDEFVVILYDTSPEAAQKIAMAISAAMNERHLAHKYSPISDTVTLTIGVFWQQPEKNHSVEEMIESADAALYRAKHQGRNTVVSLS